MALYQPVVPARYTARLLGLLQGQEARTVAALLAGAGLAPEQLGDPEYLLDFAQFDALFAALREFSGRSDLGFELGLAITRDSHGALGVAMSRCATVGAMLQLAVRHSRLMTPSFSLQFRREAGPRVVTGELTGELIWRPAAGMSTAMLQAFYEIHAVSLHQTLADAVGERLIRYTTTLPMTRPRHAGRYRELAKLQVRFAPQPLPEARSVFPAALLDLPLQSPAAADHGAETADLDALGQRYPRSRQWSDWLRLMLREAEAVQPSQVQMAKLLNVSAHTLARYLAREGQGFRQIASEVRHQRARSLLQAGSLDIGRIAQRLGYRDESNFIHAFRRLEGVSPGRYRRASAQ